MTGRSSWSRKRDRSHRRRDSSDSRGRRDHRDGTPRDRRTRSPERDREARSFRRRDRSRSDVRSRRRRDGSYGSREGSRDGALGKIIVRLNELEGRLSSSIVPPSTPTSRTALECHTPPPPPAAKECTGAAPVVTEGSSGDTGAAKGDAADRIVGALSALLQTRSSNFYISSFDPSVHDFDSWCAEVDRARLLNKWDDGECLGRIGGCLRGDAKSWLHEWVTRERTWTNFKSEFRSLCPPSVDIASILFEVMCSNSNKYVTYAEYARKSLLRLKIVTGLSDELRTAIIVRGITDPQVKAAATNAKLQSKDLVEFLSAYVKPKIDNIKIAPSNNSVRSSQIRPSYPRRFSRHFSRHITPRRRSLATVNVRSLLEPTGIARDDGKRPDGMSLIPWKMGRVLVWDATCSDTLAPSHLHGTNNRAGAACEAAEKVKACKYRVSMSSSEGGCDNKAFEGTADDGFQTIDLRTTRLRDDGTGRRQLPGPGEDLDVPDGTVTVKQRTLDCGWGLFRPKWLQRFRTAKWALFWLCWAGAIQGMTYNLRDVTYSELSARIEASVWVKPLPTEKHYKVTLSFDGVVFLLVTKVPGLQEDWVRVGK
ncbi:hypothetical protein evm_001007 [Chilo suppressalis]|nr:hypothetical protein evm_001007 [Chilo suppressalis]